MMDTKICTKCDVEKQLDDFPICKTHSTGRKSHCRMCINAAKRKRYQCQKEKFAERNRRYYGANKAAQKERTKQYFTKRYNSDPLFKANHLLKGSLRDATKKVLDGDFGSKTAFYKNKTGNICDFLVRDEQLLKEFIENDNVHIDHIYPVAQINNPILHRFLESLGIEPTEENKLNFVHSPANMQLLRAEDNLAKRDDLTFAIEYYGMK